MCHAVCGLGAIPTRWSTLWIHTCLFPLLDSTVMDFLLVGSNVSFIYLVLLRMPTKTQPVCLLFFLYACNHSTTLLKMCFTTDFSFRPTALQDLTMNNRLVHKVFSIFDPPKGHMDVVHSTSFFPQSNHCNSSTCAVFVVKGCSPFGQSQQSWHSYWVN